MESSDVRKRVIHLLDRAKRRAAEHRDEVDRTSQAFHALLPQAAAVWKQAANVLRAEGHVFAIQTPSGVLRLASERSPEDFVEIALDTARQPVAVVAHVRVARGRHVVDRESIVAEGEAILGLDEERLLDVLLQEIETFVAR